MSERYDVVIVGAGQAGGALATVRARRGIAVAVLERDPVPVDRVRGEFMAPWGVAELKRLGLLETLAAAGGVFTKRSIPYDENTPGDSALPFALDLSAILPDVPGPVLHESPRHVRDPGGGSRSGRCYRPSRRREDRPFGWIPAYMFPSAATALQQNGGRVL